MKSRSHEPQTKSEQQIGAFKLPRFPKSHIPNIEFRTCLQSRDRDKIFEEHGARIFVDPKSLLYLAGTTLEYEETLMRQGFVFQNPNAARNCGCGSSFTA